MEDAPVEPAGDRGKRQRLEKLFKKYRGTTDELKASRTNLPDMTPSVDDDTIGPEVHARVIGVRALTGSGSGEALRRPRRAT